MTSYEQGGVRHATLLCQVCGAPGGEDDEYCRRCHQKLMVVSGVDFEEEELFEEDPEEGFSFDEHLLERISILEEAVKRTADTVRQLLSVLRKQERNILINHAGLGTARELLVEKGLVAHDEWSELHSSKMDYQMLALEKRERFLAIKEKIVALYHGGERRRFEDLLENAEYALFAYDMERAVGTLEDAYKLDRENYELAYFLGEYYFNEGRTDEALAYFGRVLEVRPDHYEGLIFSGVIHHERGDNDRAEAFLRRGVSQHPDAFLPLFSLGAVYAAQGNLARATAFLERAVAVDPLPQAEFLLGRCYYEMGKTAVAIRSLRSVVRHDPGFEEAYHLLGLALLDRGWHRKALDAFRAAQRLNPKKMKYHELVRYLSGQLGTPLPKVSGKAAGWLGKAEEALGREDLKGALEAHRRALAEEPENPTLLMSYAMVCLHLDRGSEIEAVTRRVLAGSPGEMLEATAYATLIAALRSQGKLKEGNRIGRRLLAEERSEFTRTIAYYEMAYNLAEMEEDLDQALEYARRSLDLAPEELKQFPLAALGWVHYKRREYDRAVDFLARSSELGASSTTLTHLGMALLAAGEEVKAREVLSEARALSVRGEALEETMMRCMKDSGRLHDQVRSRQKR